MTDKIKEIKKAIEDVLFKYDWEFPKTKKEQEIYYDKVRRYFLEELLSKIENIETQTQEQKTDLFNKSFVKFQTAPEDVCENCALNKTLHLPINKHGIVIWLCATPGKGLIGTKFKPKNTRDKK